MAYPWEKGFWTGRTKGSNILDPFNTDIGIGEHATLGLYGGDPNRDTRLQNIYQEVTGIDAIDKQMQAQDDAMDLQRQIYQEGVQRMQPFYEQGAKYVPHLEGLAAAMQDIPMPGAATPYNMLQAPDVGGWQPSWKPEQWSPMAGPQQQAFQVGGGPTGGMYEVAGRPEFQGYNPRSADPGGMYQTRSADPGGTYQRGVFDFESDPGYQFRKEAGLEALERQAARRGGRDSGRTFKDEARFLQGLASQEYGAAHDRFMGEEAARQAAFESAAGRGLQAYGIEEPLRGRAFESAAGRGLQAYGLEEPIRAQQAGLAGQLGLEGYLGEQNLRRGAFESAADRGLSEWATRSGLDLQGYEGAQGRAADVWGQEQKLGLGGASAYADQMMGMQGLGLEGRMGADRLNAAMYQSQLPIDYQNYQYMQEDPWRRYQTEYGVDSDYYDRLANIVGNAQNAAAGLGSMGMNYSNMMGQGMMNQAMLAGQRGQAPWNALMDIAQTGAQFIPLF